MSLRLITPRRAPTEAEKQKATQTKYYVRMVKENRYFKLVLMSLKQGVPVSQIAEHFAKNHWIDVNERTFAEALRTFRRSCADEIDRFVLDNEDISKWVDPNSPQRDEYAQIQQLISFQMQRLASGRNVEKNIGMLSQFMKDEVKVTGELLLAAAKISGRVNANTGLASHSDHVSTPDVNENLNRLHKDETTRNRLHGLTKQLATTNVTS
jgi:hypothetical protein